MGAIHFRSISFRSLQIHLFGVHTCAYYYIFPLRQIEKFQYSNIKDIHRYKPQHVEIPNDFLLVVTMRG